MVRFGSVKIKICPVKKLPFRSGILLISTSLLFLGFTNPKPFNHPPTTQQQGETLFDGKSFKGWKHIVGKANYAIENGAIVGTSVIDSVNSFLVTTKEYSDFILELDVKIDNVLSNSGIQTRSHFNDADHPNKVFGRQVEVDPSPRSWTGGIYDEARRGWLYPLDKHPEAKKAFKVGEYNHFRIECIGATTTTFINGMPVARVIDSIDRKGFIALQVHAVNKPESAGHKVYFKNITISTRHLQPKTFSAEIPVVDLTVTKP
jgi:hypothetical protein